MITILVIFTSSISASDSLNDTTVLDSSNNNQNMTLLDSSVVNNSNISKDIKTSVNNRSVVKGSNTNPALNITIKDSYNSKTKNYTEEGVVVSGAVVNIYDSNNKLVFTGKSNNKGNVIVDQLNGYGQYKMTIAYSTYLTEVKYFNYTVKSRHQKMSYRFVPDMAFIVYYAGNVNKINYLMNISRRVYYINNYNPFETDKLWMLSYANFILLDMYSDDTVSKYLSYIKNSPANKNRMISYTFGVFSASTNLGLNFVGTKSSNNTINTLENTYIGSYMQANDISDSVVLKNNMHGVFNYIRFLLGETKVNPTLNTSTTPMLTSTWGIYHPGYGRFDASPSQSLINKWILADPGYNKDGQGSLNWMTGEYISWQKSNVNSSSLFDKFEKWYSSNKSNIKSPYIVIVSYYSGGNLVDALIKEYESQGRAAFNLYQSETSPSMASLLMLFAKTTSRSISAVNSLYSWSLDYANTTGGAVGSLKELNVEIIKALSQVSLSSYKSGHGPQIEWTYSVTVPSFEGVFGTVEVSYTNSAGVEVPIEAGVKKLVQMTNGWAKLKELNNSDKKVAIVLYNYPPGKSDIAASYLDIFNSTHVLLKLLADNGYNIGMSKNQIPDVDELTKLIEEACNKGTWAQGYLNDYVDKYWDTLMANGQLINYSQYKKYLNSLNSTLKNQLVKKWGSDIGKIMVYNGTKHKGKYIVIPGIMFGNIFVTFQPSRGWEEEDIANYHSATLPPHQQYISFYKWLSGNFKANAIINMGTHGTLEFLPGRDIGLQADDWSFELTEIPTVYPYIVSNPGEAMIAKNRLGSLMISHMTPATVISDLYGNYTLLNDYITLYQQAVRVGSNSTAQEYKKMILKLANSSQIKFDLPKDNSDKTFQSWLLSIDSKLDDLQNDLITMGLHSLGKVLTGDELIQEIITIVSSRTDIYTEVLHYLYPELKNMDYYSDVKGNSKYKTEVNATKTWLYNTIAIMVNGSINFNALMSFYGINSSSVLYEDLLLANSTLVALRNNEELQAIINALSGGYVRPGLCGDPAYADVLPTGTAMYTGDRTKMPTKAAWAAAKTIDDKLIVNYYLKHKKFPELVGIIMWGTEILRTDGIQIAQFMYFLGVQPVWSRSGAVTGVELMNLSDLKIKLPNGTVLNRPRIDVYTSMVTSYVNWISLLINSVKVAALDCPNETFKQNYVKKHYNQTGSLDRLFGLPGSVLEGTGLSDYIPATSNWYDKSINLTNTLTNIYLNRVSYSWGIDSDGNIVVKKATNAYVNLLKNTDLVTQNLDSTWRLTDSDDYYDWLGGLYGTSKKLGGNPDSAVVDIRNTNNPTSRTIAEQIDLEVRTTIANPKYVQALMNSGAAGANTLAAKVQDVYAMTVATSTGRGKSDISSNTWSVIAQAMADSESLAKTNSQKFGMMAASAWAMYAYFTGYWTPTSAQDKANLQKLVNNYVNNVVSTDAFACCHHTDPFSFNKDVISMYTGSQANMKKFNQLFKQMSGTNQNVYDQNANHQAANGTSSNTPNSGSSSSAGSSSSGSSSVGDQASSSTSTGSASAASSAGSSSSSGQAGSSSSGSNAKAYEVNKATQPSGGSEASLPIYVMVIIIAILVIFGFGFFKRNKDDDF
ncbi:MAG: cobaltochelatase subunit CobN [Methanobrevibacter boviskoreani]|uniref:cobaltochelatase subunit CobN n=1 Tax=Methanobrevibacter boviskoreani TaxID=1348249 RepID=UPI0023A8DCFB|nr:cobaltochelatase subunit CobN [Methanobrevibacter boviskoreani]MCI6929880.1 cobaltochelatase subunit CobN [Methanobrevibacter boviskoreani]